ncbi:hypothetical protein E3E11_06590 [Oecophyllibacter saccharovorans]|uniref:hypothetical protein n=1 Tax=Oecophyllibacter saccharovorans TaxID=2558360 RepID=UPI0011411B87|nr:hypothetical protein [Oecophyllibacter saccharovorans]QDH15572.1 hypothetical protein E3E11_06590 [Oecophyllibacter saccharovorans]
MTLSKAAVALFGFTLLAGCATAPDDVKPINVPTDSYQYMSCQQLAQEAVRVGEAQDKLADEQGSTRWRDIWTGRDILSRDHERSLARAKGELNAIQAVQKQKACGSTPVPAVPVTSAAPATPVK